MPSISVVLTSVVSALYGSRANYWSQLGADIEIDPLFKEYLEFTRLLQQSHPAPTNLPMRPENMPYYRGPRFQPPQPTDTESSTTKTLHVQSLLTDITTSTGWGHTHLSNLPIQFGNAVPTIVTTLPPRRSLLNSELALYAWQVSQYH